MDKPFLLSSHAKEDLESIRQYTIYKWGSTQWLKYKKSLRKRMQVLANNPELGIAISGLTNNAYRFPDGKYVFYYLKRKKDIIFVGFLSSNIAPTKHLKRIESIDS